MTETEHNDCWRFADLTLDAGRRYVLRAGKPLHLGRLTFDFLAVVVERAPNVVPHDELARRVWPGRIVTPENMTQRASLLRRALGDDAREPRYVRVVHGQGYQLIPPATRLTAEQRNESPPNLRRRTMATALGAAALATAGAIAWNAFVADGAGSVSNATAAASEVRAAASLPPTSGGSAVDRWRAALSEAPDDLNNLMGLGRVLCQSGKLDEALEHLRRARTLYPDSSRALESLALCLLVSRDRDAARHAIAQGATLDPHFPVSDSPKNPGFEDGMFGWSTTWDRGLLPGPNRNAVFAIDTDVMRSGKASGRLRSTVASSGATTMSSFAPLDFRGGKVRMSAYLKTERIDGDAHLWLRVDSIVNGALETTHFENTMPRGLAGDHDWTRQDLIADVSAGAVSIVYGVGFNGTGTVWFDDVEFERVDDDTPSTGISYPDVPVLPTPENLDFDHGLKGWSIPTPEGPSYRGGAAHTVDGVASLSVDDGEVLLRQDVLPGNYAGKRLRITARLNRRQAADGNLIAGMQLRPKSYFAPTLWANRQIGGGAGWKTYDLVVDVPDVATKITYYFVAAGHGTLLVDDVRLEIVDTSVPLSPIPGQ